MTDNGSRGAAVQKRTIVSYFSSLPDATNVSLNSSIFTVPSSNNTDPLSLKSSSSARSSSKKKDESIQSSAATHSSINELKKQLEQLRQAKEQAELKVTRHCRQLGMIRLSACLLGYC
jgi:hypothetical protein